MEHQKLRFLNLKNFASLVRKAQFFRSLWSRICNEAQVLYFTLWYSPYQEGSNHISFAWIQLFYQIWQAKTKPVLLILGCSLLNDQTSNSNHFIIIKILAWLSLICWVVPDGHLWAFDKLNVSPKFLSDAPTLRWKLPLRNWGSCIWGGQGWRSLSYFRVSLVSPPVFLDHTLSSKRPTKVHQVFVDVHSESFQAVAPGGKGCAYVGLNWNPIIWVHWQFWTQKCSGYYISRTQKYG